MLIIMTTSLMRHGCIDVVVESKGATLRLYELEPSEIHL